RFKENDRARVQLSAADAEGHLQGPTPKSQHPRPNTQGPIPRPNPKTQSQDPIPRPNPKTQSQDPIPRPNPKTQSQDPIPRADDREPMPTTGSRHITILRMSKLTLRLAGIEDVEAIVPLINVAFLAERPFVKDERIQAAGVRELMAKGQFLLGY